MGGLGTEPQEHGQQGPPCTEDNNSLASLPLPRSLLHPRFRSLPQSAPPVPSQFPRTLTSSSQRGPSHYLTTPSLSGTSPAPHLLPWFCPFSSAAILSWKVATQLPHLRRGAPREQKAMTWLPPQGGWEVRSPRRQNKGLAERILRGSQTPCASPCAASITRGVGARPRHFPAPGQAEKGVRGGGREGQRGHVQRNREGGSGTREEQLQPSRARWEQRRGTGSKGARKTRDGKAEGAERRETNPRGFLERLKGEGKMRFKGPRSSAPGKVGEAAHLIDFRSSLDRGQVQGSREVQPLPLPRVSRGPPRASATHPEPPHLPPSKSDKCNLHGGLSSLGLSRWPPGASGPTK